MDHIFIHIHAKWGRGMVDSRLTKSQNPQIYGVFTEAMTGELSYFYWTSTIFQMVYIYIWPLIVTATQKSRKHHHYFIEQETETNCYWTYMRLHKSDFLMSVDSQDLILPIMPQSVGLLSGEAVPIWNIKRINNVHGSLLTNAKPCPTFQPKLSVLLASELPSPAFLVPSRER